ncbi:MAG: hypothetical protein EHM13_06660 [Acidobacteria bacterium]|nr:MAG: hypothetical protein EHM13_06660 [Acidobacteriota bacterium]
MNSDRKTRGMGVGLGFGIALGAGLGAAFGAAFDNIGVGVAFGVGIGVGIGIVIGGASALHGRAGTSSRTRLSFPRRKISRIQTVPLPRRWGTRVRGMSQWYHRRLQGSTGRTSGNTR